MDANIMIAQIDEAVKGSRDGRTADIIIQSVSGVRYLVDSIEYDIDTDEVLICVGEVNL